MADFMKLFQVQNAYVDEDGCLSFNPKYGKVVGIVRATAIVDRSMYDASSFDQPNHYVSGYNNYIVSYEINVVSDVMNVEIPKKVVPKIEQKEIDKTQEEFMFLDIKD